MIRMPDRAHAGTVTPRPVNSIDLFPTLMDYCGLETPKHTPHGLSLRPLLEDPFTEWKRPAITTYGVEIFSARSERYRYIRYPDGSEESYDHDNDPYEWNNRADDTDLYQIKMNLQKWKPDSFEESNGGRGG
jgi:arylsulfatase A-like enzyme